MKKFLFLIFISSLAYGDFIPGEAGQPSEFPSGITGSGAEATSTSLGFTRTHNNDPVNSIVLATGTNVTILPGDGVETVILDPSSGGRFIDLPVVSASEIGREIKVTQTGFGSIAFRSITTNDINNNGVTTVGPSSSQVLDRDGMNVTLLCVSTSSPQWVVTSGGAAYFGRDFDTSPSGAWNAGRLRMKKIGSVVHITAEDPGWTTGSLQRDTGVIIPSEFRPGAETSFASNSPSGSGEQIIFTVTSGGVLRARPNGSGVAKPPYNINWSGSYPLRN